MAGAIYLAYYRSSVSEALSVNKAAPLNKQAVKDLTETHDLRHSRLALPGGSAAKAGAGRPARRFLAQGQEPGGANGEAAAKAGAAETDGCGRPAPAGRFAVGGAAPFPLAERGQGCVHGEAASVARHRLAPAPAGEGCKERSDTQGCAADRRQRAKSRNRVQRFQRGKSTTVDRRSRPSVLFERAGLPARSRLIDLRSAASHSIRCSDAESQAQNGPLDT